LHVEGVLTHGRCVDTLGIFIDEQGVTSVESLPRKDGHMPEKAENHWPEFSEIKHRLSPFKQIAFADNLPSGSSFASCAM